MAFEKIVDLRKRPAVIASPIKVGVAATVRNPKKNPTSKAQLELKLNVDVLEAMRLMIGDRLDAYFDAETNRVAFERHPDGAVVLRPWVYRKADYTGSVKVAGRISLSNIPGLTVNELGQFNCTYLIHPDHPSRLVITLPECFFAQENGVFAQVLAA